MTKQVQVQQLKKRYFTSEERIEDVFENLSADLHRDATGGERFKLPSTIFEAIEEDGKIFDEEDKKGLKYFLVEVMVTEFPLETRI